MEFEPIHYHDREKVNQIAQYLLAVTPEKFNELYNPEEMHKERIYNFHYIQSPEKQKNWASQVANDFEGIKKIFAKGQEQKNYVLVFVG